MKIGGVKYNFERILKISIYKPVGDDSTEVYTIKYAPQANERYCPMIDVVVNDMPDPRGKNARPGYTADVKIYNPPDSLANMFNNNKTWIHQFFDSDIRKEIQHNPKKAAEQLEKYYNSRFRVKIYAGYWRPDEKGAAREDYGNGPIFEGTITTFAYYRKGVDDILQFSGFDFDPASDLAISAIGKSLGVKTVVEEHYAEDVLGQSYKESKWRRGNKSLTWDQMSRILIYQLVTTRPKRMNIIGQQEILPRSTQSDPENEIYTTAYVSYLDRNIDKFDWAETRYLYTLERKYGGVADEKSENFNRSLRDRMVALTTEKFYTNAQTVHGALNDLTEFNGLHLNFMLDYNYVPGRIILWVWPSGDTNKLFLGADGPGVKIVNWQNLLEAPTVQGSGAIKITMLFNPACHSMDLITLVQDTSQGNDVDSLVTTANLTHGFAAAGGQGLIPTLQGNMSFSSARLSSDAEIQRELEQKGISKWAGALINIGWPMFTVRHDLSTRTGNWRTTVLTMPAPGGFKLAE